MFGLNTRNSCIASFLQRHSYLQLWMSLQMVVLLHSISAHTPSAPVKVDSLTSSQGIASVMLVAQSTWSLLQCISGKGVCVSSTSRLFMIPLQSSLDSSQRHDAKLYNCRRNPAASCIHVLEEGVNSLKDPSLWDDE